MAFVEVTFECNHINQLGQCIGIVLCKIHSFFIDNGNATPPEHYEHYVLTLMDFGNVDDGNDPHPVGLLGGGEHFDDISEGRCGANRRSQRLAARQMTNNNHNNIINNRITIPHNNMLPTMLLQEIYTVHIHLPLNCKNNN